MITEALRSRRSNVRTAPAHYQPKTSSPRRRSVAWAIGGAALVGLVVYAGFWGYPELVRTVKMHRM